MCLKIELEGIDAERAKNKKRLPVVLTSGQVSELFSQMRWAGEASASLEEANAAPSIID